MNNLTKKLKHTVGRQRWPAFWNLAARGTLPEESAALAVESGIDELFSVAADAYVSAQGDYWAKMFGPRDLRDTSDAVLASRISEKLPTSWEGKSIAMFGETGGGKTTSSVLIGRDYIRKVWRETFSPGTNARADLEFAGTHVSLMNMEDFHPIYCLPSELADAVEAHGFGKGECYEMAVVRKAKMLVIDEIGMESSRNYNLIGKLLGNAYRAGVKTVCCTGLSGGEYQDRYGDATLRRTIGDKHRPAIVVEL